MVIFAQFSRPPLVARRQRADALPAPASVCAASATARRSCAFVCPPVPNPSRSVSERASGEPMQIPHSLIALIGPPSTRHGSRRPAGRPAWPRLASVAAACQFQCDQCVQCAFARPLRACLSVCPCVSVCECVTATGIGRLRKRTLTLLAVLLLLANAVTCYLRK